MHLSTEGSVCPKVFPVFMKSHWVFYDVIIVPFFYEDLERDEIKMPYVARALVCMH